MSPNIVLNFFNYSFPLLLPFLLCLYLLLFAFSIFFLCVSFSSLFSLSSTPPYLMFIFSHVLAFLKYLFAFLLRFSADLYMLL
jgi:hypothetical protein